MPFVVRVAPNAERVLATLTSKRAHALRESLLEQLEKVAQLAALRRFGDEAETEVFCVRVGSLEAHYTVDRWEGTVTLHEVVRLPSTRVHTVA